MAKHTPSPWTVQQNATTDQILTIQAEPISGPNKWRIATVSNTNGPIGQANARLIAAAPEMLEGLKSLMVAYGAVDGRNGNSGECWDKARAAVTMAEG